MDPTNARTRRIGVGGGAVVVAGSVWEARMQSNDEVSNNAIVKAKATEEDNNSVSNKQMSLKDLGVNGKRRTWQSGVSDLKSPSHEIDRRGNSLKLNRPRFTGNTPPVTPRRSISSDANDKSLTVVSVVAKKARSDSSDGIEKTPSRVKKTRSELCTAIVKSGEFDSVALRKVNSLPARNSEKTNNKTEHVDAPSVLELVEDNKEETVNEKLQISEEVKELDVGGEKIVSANSNVEDQIDNGDHDEDGDEEEVEEEEEEEEVEEGEREVEKNVDVKEMNVAKEKSKNRVGTVEINKFSQFQNRTAPSPSSIRKIPSPVIKRATSVYSVPPKTDRFSEEKDNFTRSQSKLQSLVDLMMWKDVSRSALVFGFGTFLIVSSSYASDLNFSFISVLAYMGLIYLALMFVLRSVIQRGLVVEEESHKQAVMREEDVKRMLRLIMPYLNESLLQLKALFSGDPSTTLKMGMVLFVLAKCGSSITLWNLTKFGFLGAFTVPRIFISYSTHFSAYGNFWVRRFRDAWESCSHKKAVALALFTLVWNLSSVIARFWAAFMLLVAFRYYQQKMIWTSGDDDDDGNEEDVVEDEEDIKDEQVPKFKRAPHMMMPNKLKKFS